MTNLCDCTKEREVCVFYLTATCNLKCRYCYIDKSDVLVKIDQILEESYKDNYYFDFMKEIFPDPYQLKEIEFWGGEPTYGLHRVEHIIQDAIKYYPRLHSFMLSTNLTTEKGFQDLCHFFTIFKDFPDRQFTFNLQLSLDGPESINDLNRGKGTTKLFTKYFSKLLIEIDPILNNVPNLSIHAFFKPTLDASSLAQLQTKDDIIKYYQFFEFYKKASDTYVFNNRWDLAIPTPNTATPSPHTVEDGKNFANFCKICRDIIIDDNNGESVFQYPRNIMPFFRNDLRSCADTSFKRGCGTCGAGSRILGLLPNHLISSCHSGFVDLLEDYKLQCIARQDSVDRTIDVNLFLPDGIRNTATHTLEEYKMFEQQMKSFNQDAKFQISELASLIQLYAFAGQIDKKYYQAAEAVKAAHFIQDHTASCVRDNLGETGSKFLFQVGFIKLFLNGAKEYIEDVERHNAILAGIE